MLEGLTTCELRRCSMSCARRVTRARSVARKRRSRIASGDAPMNLGQQGRREFS